MKFINYLKSIEGVDIYPLITLLLFFFIFILALVMVFSKSDETINEIKNIPLND